MDSDCSVSRRAVTDEFRLHASGKTPSRDFTRPDDQIPSTTIGLAPSLALMKDLTNADFVTSFANVTKNILCFF